MYLPEVGCYNCIHMLFLCYMHKLLLCIKKRYSKCEEMCANSMPQSKILGLGIKATLTVQPIAQISTSSPCVA